MPSHFRPKNIENRISISYYRERPMLSMSNTFLHLKHLNARSQEPDLCSSNRTQNQNPNHSYKLIITCTVPTCRQPYLCGKTSNIWRPPTATQHARPHSTPYKASARIRKSGRPYREKKNRYPILSPLAIPNVLDKPRIPPQEATKQAA